MVSTQTISYLLKKSIDLKGATPYREDWKSIFIKNMKLRQFKLLNSNKDQIIFKHSFTTHLKIKIEEFRNDLKVSLSIFNSPKFIAILISCSLILIFFSIIGPMVFQTLIDDSHSYLNSLAFIMIAVIFSTIILLVGLTYRKTNMGGTQVSSPHLKKEIFDSINEAYKDAKDSHLRKLKGSQTRNIKYCPTCGKEIKETWKVCPYCTKEIK
ncbi:MAG: zinc-ribbon domain-containing protein [Candidatus Lokiarchaeota archaeon]|nr:zinc-ribbon domain-containing protein [Candidatus Lokiarchaeota archaeon]